MVSIIAYDIVFLGSAAVIDAILSDALQCKAIAGGFIDNGLA